MKESELIKNAQKGDKNAFCELYELYKNRLYRLPIISFQAKKTQRTPLWIAFSALGRG